MSEAAAARGFAARVALFYGALFVVYGMHVPFMPVWLDWRGLSAAQISTVMAAPFFLRLFITPAVALSADRNGTHRTILIWLAWTALAIVLALSQAASFWPILLLAVPLVICNSTIMPLIETIAVSGMRQRGLDYGRMRLWGSLTFVAASFAGGFAVARYGAGVGVWLVAFGSALTVVAANLLPRATIHVPKDAAVEPFWTASAPRMLLRNPSFRIFLLAGGLVQAAHAMFMTFGVLIWQKQGLSGVWCGTLWAIGVFAEVALFAISGKLVETVGAARLLVIASAASIIRWFVMGLEPSLAVLIPLQALHGVTYGVAHIAAIHFIHDAVPRKAAGSAQALYATVSAGVAMGVTTLIAGWLYARIGVHSYLAMSGVAVLALLAALHLQRSWSGAELAEPSVS